MNHLALIEKTTSLIAAGDIVGAEGALAELADEAVSYTHLRAHETVLDLVCRLLLEKNKHTSVVAQQLICW